MLFYYQIYILRLPIALFTDSPRSRQQV